MKRFTPRKAKLLFDLMKTQAATDCRHLDKSGYQVGEDSISKRFFDAEKDLCEDALFNGRNRRALTRLKARFRTWFNNTYPGYDGDSEVAIVDYHELLEVICSTSRRIRRIEKRESRTNGWMDFLGWLVPRKYREAVICDIYDDVNELRQRGIPEGLVVVQATYQFLIASLALNRRALWITLTAILAKIVGGK